MDAFYLLINVLVQAAKHIIMGKKLMSSMATSSKSSRQVFKNYANSLGKTTKNSLHSSKKLKKEVYSRYSVF